MAAAGPRPRQRTGLFYGWWLVMASTVFNVYLGGTWFYGFGAFFDPIKNTFGWSRAATSVAFVFQRLEAGIAAPIVGFLFDRLGPRLLSIFGTLVGGLGFIYLSQVNSLGSFYLGFVIISIGFSASSAAVGQAVVANWFIRRRGQALGILMAGFGLSGLLVPFLVRLVDTAGWRPALIYVGAGVWIIGIPVSLLMRHRPEQMGLLPDNAPAQEGGAEEATTLRAPRPYGFVLMAGEAAFSLGETLRTRTFWLIAVAYALGFVSTSSVVVHEIPYLTSLGFSRETAALILTTMTMLSVFGRLGFGWLADRWDKRLVLGLAFALQSAGVMVFSQIRGPWTVALFLLAYAPGYGGNIPVRSATIGEYFGRKNFGTIMGVLQGVTSLGGMVGPVAAGLAYDMTGSYRSAFLLFGALNFIAVPLILLARRPSQGAAAQPAGIAAQGTPPG